MFPPWSLHVSGVYGTVRGWPCPLWGRAGEARPHPWAPASGSVTAEVWPGALAGGSCLQPLHTLGPWSLGGLPAGGGVGAFPRPSSQGRSVQSPGVANLGLGQLRTGAEAVISGPENSCPEQAPKPCPHGRSVLLPGGPPGSVPPPTHAFPFQGGGVVLCTAPCRGPQPAQRSLAGKEASRGKASPPAFCIQDKASPEGWPGPRSVQALSCSSRN